MARWDGNMMLKCIHEALDLGWCDCPDEVRAELQVKLPKPEPRQDVDTLVGMLDLAWDVALGDAPPVSPAQLKTLAVFLLDYGVSVDGVEPSILARRRLRGPAS